MPIPHNPNFHVDLAAQLYQQTIDAARDGVSLLEAERMTNEVILRIGRVNIDLFLSQQGNGDHGESVEVESETLVRSSEPEKRVIRSVFGLHEYHAYVYGKNLHQKIDCRPVDVRMQMPDGRYSPLLVEYTQLLCIESAHGQAANIFKKIFLQDLSVNSLERINRRVGAQAEEFLYTVPIPKPKDEGSILVVSADGKGVPMKKEETLLPLPFEHRDHPGNRRMATLAAVYSVNPFVRTPQEFIDALFRKSGDKISWKRPEPVGKVVTGCLTKVDEDGEPMSGEIRSLTWAAEQVEQRLKKGQVLTLLIDGQHSLWETARICLEDRDIAKLIEILDIIHVSGYVWDIAKVLYSDREKQEAFTKDRLLRILEGKLDGVIAGVRQQATKLHLSKQARKIVEKACGYFERNRHRMKYDEYLKAGLPIATGVIEGACRHLVMDRMCRTGMRWTTAGAQAMINVRAVHQAGHADSFQTYLANLELKKTRKYLHLLKDHHPLIV
jgi:hypothetical protein